MMVQPTKMPIMMEEYRICGYESMVRMSLRDCQNAFIGQSRWRERVGLSQARKERGSGAEGRGW